MAKGKNDSRHPESTIVSGFLFTAVPNWTGRRPLQGNGLLALALLWLTGGLTVTFSAHIGWLLAMAVDGAFLVAVTFIFVAVLIAAVTRILAAMIDIQSGLMLHGAAFAWMTALRYYCRLCPDAHETAQNRLAQNEKR